VAAAGTVAAAAAAFNLFSAATGIQVHASDRNAQAIGTGQAIALGARDEASVGVELTRDISFAPGYESWRAGTIAFQTTLAGGAPFGHAYITSSALRWQVAESAVCSWLSYPSGLGRVVAAVGAGDAELVQGLIDTGHVGNCTAIGPFPPPGMSPADRQAKLAAASQVGQQEIATDPVAQRLGISGSPSVAPPHGG
jgi:hypothetical protein